MSRRQRKPSKANRKGVIKNAPNPDRPKRPYIKKTYENKEPKMTRTRLRNITTQECDRMFWNKDKVVDKVLENVELPVPNLGEEEPMETDKIGDPIPEKIQEVVEVVATSGELLEKQPEEAGENVDKVAEVQSMTQEVIDIPSTAEVVEEEAMDETEEIIFMKQVKRRPSVKEPRNQIVKKVLRPKRTLLIFINKEQLQTERVASTSERFIVEEALEEANGQEIMVLDQDKGTSAVEKPKEPNVEKVPEYIGHENEVTTSEEVNREEEPIEEPIEEPGQEEKFEKLEEFMIELAPSPEHKQPEKIEESVEVQVAQVPENMGHEVEVVTSEELNREEELMKQRGQEEEEEEVQKLEEFMEEVALSPEYEQPEKAEDSVELSVAQVLEGMLKEIEDNVPVENPNEPNMENDMLQNIEMIVPLENRNERNIENVKEDEEILPPAVPVHWKKQMAYQAMEILNRAQNQNGAEQMTDVEVEMEEEIERDGNIEEVPPIFDIQTNIRFPAAFLDVKKISGNERDRFEINLSHVEVKSRRWTVCVRRNSKNLGKRRPITRLLLEIENVANEEDVEKAHQRIQKMADSFSHWFKGEQAREGFVQVLKGIFSEQ